MANIEHEAKKVEKDVSSWSVWRTARVVASLFVLMVAAYYTIVAFDNITNPVNPNGSNWPFVQGVLSGDGVPADSGFQWRFIDATWFQAIGYILIITGETITVDDIVEVERLRVVLHRHVGELFREVDVLALPTTQVAPFPADQEYPSEVAGVTMPDYLGWMMSCCVITATECPAISIPAGFTADGLPVGLQLVAAPGCERQLLEVAAAIETAAPHHHRVPAC